jgi:hypothetical protein
MGAADRMIGGTIWQILGLLIDSVWPCDKQPQLEIELFERLQKLLTNPFPTENQWK